jgi:choline dehydrogenase-like flavoprotein
MPYTDFEKSDNPYSGDEFDYVVVGAGAAGIMISIELSRLGYKVLILESGHFKEDSERQKYNHVIQKGKELQNAVWGRCRAVGGTTLKWGGQSLPFSKLDLEPREWVENSGWPIHFEDIGPYYLDANRFMNVDTLDYRADMFSRFGNHMPDLDPYIDFHFSKWAPQPDFRKLYGPELERSVAVLFNAMTTRLDTDENGRVTSVEVSNYSGRKGRIRTNNLFIAAGGIETVRILLSNRKKNGTEIGNDSDWLGKSFMDHPCMETGDIIPKDAWSFQRMLNINILGGRKYSKRLSFSESIQRHEKLLHASASVMFGYPEEDFDPYHEIKSLRNRKIPNIGRLMRNSDVYLLGLWALKMHRFIYKHRARARLALMLEQEPIRSSHIALSDVPDDFGIPKAEIHWDISFKTWESACAMSFLVGKELTRLGIADYHPHSHVRLDQPDWKSHLHDVNHHMGGTRMGSRPEDGVVDTNLRVWGCENLFILSTSVFPTGSHSNPTLTMLALGQKWIRENAN